MNLHAKLDDWFTARMDRARDEYPTWRIIPGDDGSPYLGRVYVIHWLRELFPGWFLHRFFRSDADREHHNHPWTWAIAIVLTGGYIEQRSSGVVKNGRVALSQVVTKELRPLSVNVIRRDTFHRVELLDEQKGAWTLFIAGPRAKEPWGFADLKTGLFETNEARDRRLHPEWFEEERKTA